MLYHKESGYRLGAGHALSQKEKLAEGTMAELERIITSTDEPIWARLSALDAYALIVAKEKNKKEITEND